MPNLTNNVKFLFASDGSLSSEGLSVFLQTKSNFLMVAECNNGASTIAAVESQSPEIAVIDAQLPDMSAAQIIEAVRTKNKNVKIIVLGLTSDRETADQLLAAGGDAYVVRSGPSRHLNDAIRYVRDGGKYLAPELTKDAPVAARAAQKIEDSEAVASLHKAMEAQGRTVDRLENAMERAQHAIELLQQKVEQLKGVQVEAPPLPMPKPSSEGGGGGMLSGVRAKVGAAAAALMVGTLGFLLAGILQPATPHMDTVAEFSSMGAEDAVRSTTSASLHLAGWEIESVDKAAVMMRNQQYASAEKLCRTLLKQNPANFAASRVLASALFHQDKIEESADVVRSMAVPATRVVRAPVEQFTFEN